MKATHKTDHLPKGNADISMDQASNALKLTDLNDFINPSKSCIKPLITEEEEAPLKPNPSVLLKKKSVNSSINNINNDERNNSNKSKNHIGKIKLDDCLACSGCVTSAEMVFVEQQSINEFIEFLSTNNKLPHHEKRLLVVSISPQSVLSLADSIQLSFYTTISFLIYYFKNKCNAKFVFNHFEINSICLEESTLEFVKRYKEATLLGKNVRVFSSSCPGWACYAEKRTEGNVVSELSQIRSIQGIMGGLVKRILPFEAHTIYHLAVMPCFDRKLEAARPDMIIQEKNDSFSTNKDIIRETDIVVTSFELYKQLINEYELNEDDQNNPINKQIESLLSNKNYYFDSIYENKLKIKADQRPIYYRNIGGESGGLAINVFINACELLFNVKVDVVESEKNGVHLEIPIIIQNNNTNIENNNYRIHQEYIKSSDYYEFSLEKISENIPIVLLRFARVYGFRSIQNLLMRLKKLSPNYYQYIEVMACPNGGCLNGGGQILFHSQNSVLTKNQSLKDIRNRFNELPPPSPKTNESLLYAGNHESALNGIPLTTAFHKVTTPSNESIKNNNNTMSNIMNSW